MNHKRVLFSTWLAEGRLQSIKSASDQAQREIAKAAAAGSKAFKK